MSTSASHAAFEGGSDDGVGTGSASGTGTAASQCGTATPKARPPILVAPKAKAAYAQFPRPRRKGLPTSSAATSTAASAVSNLVSLLPPSPIKDMLRAVSGGSSSRSSSRSIVVSSDSILLDKGKQEVEAIDLPPVSQLQLISSRDESQDQHSDKHQGRSSSRSSDEAHETDDNPWRDALASPSMESEEQEVLTMLDTMASASGSASSSRSLAHQRGYSEPSLAIAGPSRPTYNIKRPLPPSPSQPTIYTHHQQSTSSSHFSGAPSSSFSSRASSPFSPGSRRWDAALSPNSPFPPTPNDGTQGFFPGIRPQLGSANSIEYSMEEMQGRRPRPGRMMTDYTMATSIGEESDEEERSRLEGKLHGNDNVAPSRVENASIKSIQTSIKESNASFSQPGPSTSTQPESRPSSTSKPNRASNLIRLFEHGLVLEENRQEALAPPAPLSSSRAASSCYSATVRPRLLRASDMLGVGSIVSPSVAESGMEAEKQAKAATPAMATPPPPRSPSPKHRWTSSSMVALRPTGLVHPASEGEWLSPGGSPKAKSEGGGGSGSRSSGSGARTDEAPDSPGSRKGSLPLTDLVPRASTADSLEAKLRKRPSPLSCSPVRDSGRESGNGNGGSGGTGGVGTVASQRRATQEGDLPASPEEAVSMVKDPHAMPLQAGSLWYYDVHRTAPAHPAWVAAQAVLFEGALALSWCPEDGGRENVVFELDKCSQVHSLPSIDHPAGVDDEGGKSDGDGSSKAREQGLVKLKPFQFVFEDGVERMATDSIRERAQWVGRARDALRTREAAATPATPATPRSPSPAVSAASAVGASRLATTTPLQTLSTPTHPQRVGSPWRDVERTSHLSQRAPSVAPTLPPKDERYLASSRPASYSPAPRSRSGDVRVSQPQASGPAEDLLDSQRPSLSLLPSASFATAARSFEDDGTQSPASRLSIAPAGAPPSRLSPLPRSEAAFAFRDPDEEDEDIFPADSASQRPPRSDVEGDKSELPDFLSTLHRRRMSRDEARATAAATSFLPPSSSRASSPSRASPTPAQTIREQYLGAIGRSPSPGKLGTVLEEAAAGPLAASRSSSGVVRSGSDGKTSIMDRGVVGVSVASSSHTHRAISKTSTSATPSPSPSRVRPSSSIHARSASPERPASHRPVSTTRSQVGENGHAPAARAATSSSPSDIDKVLEYLSREQQMHVKSRQQSRVHEAEEAEPDDPMRRQIEQLRSNVSALSGVKIVSPQQEQASAVAAASAAPSSSRRSRPLSTASSIPASEAHINEVKQRLDRLLEMVEDVHQRTTSASTTQRQIAKEGGGTSSEVALSAIGADIKQLLRKVEAKSSPTTSRATKETPPEAQASPPDGTASRSPHSSRSPQGRSARIVAPSSAAQSYVSAASTAPPPPTSAHTSPPVHRGSPRHPAVASGQPSRHASPGKESQMTMDMEAAVRRQRSRVRGQHGLPRSPPDAAAHVAGGWYSAPQPRGGPSGPPSPGRQPGSVLAHMPMAQPMPADMAARSAAPPSPSGPSGPSGPAPPQAPHPDAANGIAELTRLITDSLREQTEGRRAEREQQTDIARYLNELNKWLEQDVEERNKDFKTLREGVERVASDLAGMKEAASASKTASREGSGSGEEKQPSVPGGPPAAETMASMPTPEVQSQPQSQQTERAAPIPEPGSVPFPMPDIPQPQPQSTPVPMPMPQPQVEAQRQASPAPAPAPASAPQPATVEDAPDSAPTATTRAVSPPTSIKSAHHHRSASLQARLLSTAQDEIKRHITAHHRFGRAISPTGGSSGTLAEDIIRGILEAAAKEDHKGLRKLVKEAAMAGAGALAIRLLEEHFKKTTTVTTEAEVGADHKPPEVTTTSADVPQPDGPAPTGPAPATMTMPVPEPAPAPQDVPAQAPTPPPAPAPAADPPAAAPAPAPTPPPPTTTAAEAPPAAAPTTADPAPDRDPTEGPFATATRAELTAGLTSLLSTLNSVLTHLQTRQETEDTLRREAAERDTERQQRDEAWRAELVEQQERHAAAIVAAVTEHLANKEKERAEAEKAKQQELDPKRAIEALVVALNETRLAEAARRQATDQGIAELATSVVRGVEDQHGRLLASLTALSRDVVCTSVDNHLQHFKGAMATSFAGSAQAMADAWTKHAEVVAKTPRATLMAPPPAAAPAPAPAPAAAAAPSPPKPRNGNGKNGNGAAPKPPPPRPQPPPPLGPYGLPAR